MTRLTALAGVLCISFSAIFVRLADVSPDTATLFRVLYALPFLGLAWLAVRSRDRRSGPARLLAFASGVLLAFDLTVFHHSIALIGAGLATVLASTQVVFVGIAAWILHRERPSRAAFVVVPLVFAGVALISGLGRSDSYGSDPVRGALLGLLAGIAYGTFLLVFRASNRRHLAPTSGPLLDATAGAVLGSLVLGALFGELALSPAWPAHGWLVALAVVAQTAGWLLIAVALPRLPALDTSVLLLIQPAAAIIWAYLIFTEQLSLIQWLGVLVVLVGILILSLRGIVEREPLAEAVAVDMAGG